MIPRIMDVMANWAYHGMASMRISTNTQMIMPAKINPPKTMRANPILLNRSMVTPYLSVTAVP